MVDQPKVEITTRSADKTLTCRDCGVTFVFTVGEQEFYRQRGLLNDPQRCPSCRAARRRERTGQPPREMHQVTCAACGAIAVVPFLPRQDRPVYCSTCYDKARSDSLN
jgi:CxxC-x17-CxxC domain-containing protein